MEVRGAWQSIERRCDEMNSCRVRSDDETHRRRRRIIAPWGISGSCSSGRKPTPSSSRVDRITARGSGQTSPREYACYVRSSITSSKESEHHLLVARDTNAVVRRDADAVIAEVIEVRKMLHGLLRYLATLEPPQPPSKRPKPRRRKD